MVDALNQAKAFLQEITPGSMQANLTTKQVIALIGNPKWEVRKACAEALCYGTAPASLDALQRLSEDSMPYVQQAALKSIREAKKITTKVYEKHDPTAERLFTLIKKMNPRNVREAYAAALQVGQIFYRELAGITTHELKTSLVLISDLANNIMKDSQTGDLENLEENRLILRQTVDDLLKIVSGLSDLSREPTKNEWVHIDPAIAQAIVEAQASHPDVDVTYYPPNRESKLLGDPTFLVVALRNLILNAMEASQPGKRVEMAARHEDSSIVITIQDQGMGMTDQQIVEAFKPFNSSKKADGGMGMGIPIAQKIIHFDFGGELKYESEVGKGTKVIIELPKRYETPE